MTSLDIERFRAEIDELDRETVGLVSRRQHWVEEAGKLIGWRRPASSRRIGCRSGARRVQKVIAKVQSIAKESGAAPDVVERMYRAMIAGLIDLGLSVHQQPKS